MPDPVTEGPRDNNPDFMATGGAGPVGTLSTNHHELSRHPDAPLRPLAPSPIPGNTAASPPPTRRRGPDGTPFGALPKYTRKKGSVLGFGEHVMNTYKHIKAEHDAGHRSRGALEMKVDELRGKSAAGSGYDKLQKNEGERAGYERREEFKVTRVGDDQRRDHQAKDRRVRIREPGEDQARGDGREISPEIRNLPPPVVDRPLNHSRGQPGSSSRSVSAPGSSTHDLPTPSPPLTATAQTHEEY